MKSLSHLRNMSLGIRNFRGHSQILYKKKSNKISRNYTGKNRSRPRNSNMTIPVGLAKQTAIIAI